MLKLTTQLICSKTHPKNGSASLPCQLTIRHCVKQNRGQMKPFTRIVAGGLERAMCFYLDIRVWTGNSGTRRHLFLILLCNTIKNNQKQSRVLTICAFLVQSALKMVKFFVHFSENSELSGMEKSQVATGETTHFPNPFLYRPLVSREVQHVHYGKIHLSTSSLPISIFQTGSKPLSKKQL